MEFDDDLVQGVLNPTPSPTPYSQEFSATWTPTPTPSHTETAAPEFDDDLVQEVQAPPRPTAEFRILRPPALTREMTPTGYDDDLVQEIRPTVRPSRPSVIGMGSSTELDPTRGNIFSALFKSHPAVSLARGLGALGMSEADQPELAASLFPTPLSGQEEESLKQWAPTIAAGVGSMFLPEAAIARTMGLSVPTVASTANVLFGRGQRAWENWNQGMPLGSAIKESIGFRHLPQMAGEAALPAILHGLFRGVQSGDEFVGADTGLDAPIPNALGSKPGGYDLLAAIKEAEDAAAERAAGLRESEVTPPSTEPPFDTRVDEGRGAIPLPPPPELVPPPDVGPHFNARLIDELGPAPPPTVSLGDYVRGLPPDPSIPGDPGMGGFARINPEDQILKAEEPGGRTAVIERLLAAKNGTRLGLRSAAGWLPNSPSIHLRQLQEDMRNSDVLSARIEQAARQKMDEILEPLSGSQFDEVSHYMRGTEGQYSPGVVTAGDRIRDEVMKPLARLSHDVNLTQTRDAPLTLFDQAGTPIEVPNQKLIPFQEIEENYVPDYYEKDPTVARHSDFVSERGAARVDPLAHTRSGTSNQRLITDIRTILNRHIPEASRRIGLAGGLGPQVSLEGGAAGFGILAREALKKAAEEGLDPIGYQIATKALETAYYPRLVEETFDQNLAKIAGRMYLGKNWINQARQVSSSVGRYGFANSAEGMLRYLTDPEFRQLMRTSGAGEPGYLRNLQEAGILGKEDLLGRSIGMTENINRTFFSAGAIPAVQRLQRQAQAGAWTRAMEVEAGEFGLTREMLEKGLSAGDIQNAIARSIQDVQLYPGGIGQRIGFAQSPKGRAVMGYADFPVTQMRMFKQRTLNPIGRGFADWAPTELGLGLGRLGRAAGTSAAASLGVGALSALASLSPRIGERMKQNFTPAEVANDILTDMTGLPGVMLEAKRKGYPLFQAIAGAPLATSLAEAGNPLDLAIILDTMRPGIPGLSQAGSVLPFLRGPIQDWWKYERARSKRGGVAER